MRPRNSSLYLTLLALGCGCAAEVPAGEDEVGVTEEALTTVHRHTLGVDAEFNGDFAGDVMIVTDTGSYEYNGKPGTAGGLNEGIWNHGGLTRGQVSYVYGRFNADPLQTSTGAVQVLGKTTGGFTGNKWSRSDLPLNAATFF